MPISLSARQMMRQRRTCAASSVIISENSSGNRCGEATSIRAPPSEMSTTVQLSGGVSSSNSIQARMLVLRRIELRCSTKACFMRARVCSSIVGSRYDATAGEITVWRRAFSPARLSGSLGGNGDFSRQSIQYFEKLVIVKRQQWNERIHNIAVGIQGNGCSSE